MTVHIGSFLLGVGVGLVLFFLYGLIVIHKGKA